MSRPSPSTLRRLQRAVDHAEQHRADRTGPHRQPLDRGGDKEKLIVTAMANDYLSARFIDADGAATGDAIDIAKPEQLRHDVTLYASLTTLDTDSANQVSVSDGTTDEVWAINPAIAISSLITAMPVGYSGVSVDYGDGPVDLKWQLDGPWAWANTSDASA